MRARALPHLVGVSLLILGSLLSGCGTKRPAETFPYTINGVYVGMPSEAALNMLGAPPQAEHEDYVKPGVRIRFMGGEVYSVMGQIMSDEANVVLRAEVDGPKTVYKKLGQPNEVVQATKPHSYFNQILIYGKGDQMLVIPIDAKTSKIWAIRMQTRAEGYQDMEEN